ncbi:hypothetical protein RQP46_003372 [Phenoliferia psychrophenolica]
MGLGDYSAQLFFSGPLAATSWDIVRTARFAFYGASMGPLAGAWNKFLEVNFPLRKIADPIEMSKVKVEQQTSPIPGFKLPPGSRLERGAGAGAGGAGSSSSAKDEGVSTVMLAKRVAADQFIMAPASLFIFLFSMSLLEGLDGEQTSERIRSQFWAILSVNWMCGQYSKPSTFATSHSSIEYPSVHVSESSGRDSCPSRRKNRSQTKSVHLPLLLKPTRPLTGKEALSRAWARYGIKQQTTSHDDDDQSNGNDVTSNESLKSGEGGKKDGGVVLGDDGEHFEKAAVGGPATGTGTGEGVKVQATEVGRAIAYTIPVKIGTPGQLLNLIVDTSSTQLWVVGSKFREPPEFAAGEHTPFDPQLSSTAERQVGQIWGSLVGEGTEARGEVYVDKVSIGSVTIPRQTIEVARHLRRGVLESGCDGVLGLGLGDDNHVLKDGKRTDIDGCLHNLQGLLDSPVFSVNLQPAHKQGLGSFYTFGSIDKGITSRALSFTHVGPRSELGDGGWSFASTAFMLDGEKMRRGPGTSLILLDDDMCSLIYSKIPGAINSTEHSGWIFPRTATPPSLQLAVGSGMYSISAPTFVFDGLEEGEGGEMAFGAIQSNGGTGVLVFGDAFFHNVYVVFDYGQKRIGCAQKSA